MQKEFLPIPALNGTVSDFKSMLSEKEDAFTLAETLITLAVIGVVAALTIPTLMQVYKDKQLETAKKKAMTTVGNGYKLMVAENDGASDDSLPLFKCGQDFSCLSEVHRKFFQIGSDSTKTHEGFAEKYTKSEADEEAGFKWDDVPYIFTTNDGMTYGYLARGNTFEIVVDVNGDKGPNKICEDVIKLGFNGSTVTESGKKENGEEYRYCEVLDNSLAGGCSAENITACSTPEEVGQIFNSMAEYEGGSSVRYAKISGGKCLLMADYDDDYVREWFGGGNTIEIDEWGRGADSGFYNIVSSGSAVYETYCN